MAYNDPDDFDDQNDDGEDPSRVTLSRDQIRSMERDAKKARLLEKENAFLKAGIDTETPLGALLFQAYDGPLEADAIRDAWGKVAPAPAPPAEGTPPASEASTPPADADQQAFQEERRRLAAGGTGDDGTSPDRDPRKVAIEDANRLMAEGKSRDEALAEAFSSIAGAAAAGDSRVIWSP